MNQSMRILIKARLFLLIFLTYNTVSCLCVEKTPTIDEKIISISRQIENDLREDYALIIRINKAVIEDITPEKIEEYVGKKSFFNTQTDDIESFKNLFPGESLFNNKAQLLNYLKEKLEWDDEYGDPIYEDFELQNLVCWKRPYTASFRVVGVVWYKQRKAWEFFAVINNYKDYYRTNENQSNFISQNEFRLIDNFHTRVLLEFLSDALNERIDDAIKYKIPPSQVEEFVEQVAGGNSVSVDNIVKDEVEKIIENEYPSLVDMDFTVKLYTVSVGRLCRDNEHKGEFLPEDYTTIKEFMFWSVPQCIGEGCQKIVGILWLKDGETKKFYAIYGILY